MRESETENVKIIIPIKYCIHNIYQSEYIVCNTDYTHTHAQIALAANKPFGHAMCVYAIWLIVYL